MWANTRPKLLQAFPSLEPPPRGCIVEEVEGGGEEDPAWVVIFMDDAVSVEVQWEAGGGRCL